MIKMGVSKCIIQRKREEENWFAEFVYNIKRYVLMPLCWIGFHKYKHYNDKVLVCKRCFKYQFRRIKK